MEPNLMRLWIGFIYWVREHVLTVDLIKNISSYLNNGNLIT